LLVAAGVARDVRARERSSDHAPAWIEVVRIPAAGAAADEASMRLTLHSIQVAKVGWVLAGIGSLLAVADA